MGLHVFSQIPLEKEGLTTVRAVAHKCFQGTVAYVVCVSITFERKSLWTIVTWILEFSVGEHVSCQGTGGIQKVFTDFTLYGRMNILEVSV